MHWWGICRECLLWGRPGNTHFGNFLGKPISGDSQGIPLEGFSVLL